MAKRQLIDNTESVTSDKQHTSPCSDCPWARTALNGWLGGESIEGWLHKAHADGPIICHVISNRQCAGAAIYRTNVCKLAHPPLLRLAADKEKVFATPMEFTEHHKQPWQPKP